MMNTKQIGIYARVALPSQVAAHPIASQVAALRARVAQDGLAWRPEMQFIEEGYSGTTLVRPALARLRAVVAAGAIDRLYIPSPDRLARRYADLVLLVDEFQRQGVEVIFLNGALERSSKDDLLLKVPWTMAE